MGITKTQEAVKRVVFGRTLATGELGHTLFPKTLALPVFSSDPLSSNAYATQEIILMLAVAGTAAFSLILPITLAVAVLLVTVVISYRQTVQAYPNGGGSYIVSHENLGMYPGLLAGAALLVDYVLTVSVSVSAGADAIVSAVSGLEPLKVQLAVAFVVFVTLMNLRGARESGIVFAIPTYGFVLSVYVMLVAGIIKCLGTCPQAETAHEQLRPHAALGLFLVLRAFSAGTTALTGVEAISNGVPAFRYPQGRNAATTLTMMAVFSISMFIGISWLADQTNVVYTEETERTVVAQIAHAVFGGGPLFYVVQAMTAAILILAANTAYQDFPRLSSILARDEFMPHQFMNRGNRLVFRNGIIVLAVLASLLIVAFHADSDRLIQLYLVGVFIAFTLSQAGMVVHWRRGQEGAWKRNRLINGFGAGLTGIVLLVIVGSKFTHGAWLVVIAIPVLMYVMRCMNRHYEQVREELEHPERRPPERRPADQHMVVLADRPDEATARAIEYARSVRVADLHGVTFDANTDRWNEVAPDIPLDVLSPDGSKPDALKRYLREKREGLSPDDFLTVVIPEVLRRRSVLEIFRRPRLHLLKASLLRERGVQVADVPFVREEADPRGDEAREAANHYAVVLVTRVHNATTQALEYAETLQPTEIRAVNLGLDPAASEKLASDWLEAGIAHRLEIEASPFRDVGASLIDYIRTNFNPDGVTRLVTLIIPEFVVTKRRHQLLHGQTALVIKRHLLFERGVVAASVPYHLDR